MTFRNIRSQLSFLLLFISVIATPLCVKSQEEIVLQQTGSSTINMIPGVTYRIYDPGEHSSYPLQCDVFLHLAAPTGAYINISGSYELAFINDSITIYNSDRYGRNRIDRFMGYGSFNVTCNSGHSYIHFQSDAYTEYPGFVLEATALCSSPREIHSIWSKPSHMDAEIAWSDSSMATQWIVRWGTDPSQLNQAALATQTRHTITDLTPNTQYYFIVYNNQGDDTSNVCVPVNSLRTRCAPNNHEIVHEIDEASVFISNSDACSCHVITGYTEDTNRRVLIERGFRGSVVLRDLTMDYSSSYPHHPAIQVQGEHMIQNRYPVTEVDFILDGDNRIIGSLGSRDHNFTGKASCIQVDQGTTARFTAANPALHSSGTLCITKSVNCGIGPSNEGWTHEGAHNYTTTDRGRHPTSYGGNIVIHSGIIQSNGFKGAAIGGTFGNFWEGTILITGGIVRCRNISVGNGIGNGALTVNEITDERCSNSNVIILPPAHVDTRRTRILGTYTSASGWTSVNPVPLYEYDFMGVSNIINYNDPELPVDTFGTYDHRPNLPIYMDLSGRALVRNFCLPIADTRYFDITRIPLGLTDSSGWLIMHLNLINGGVGLFYTEERTSQGRYYEAVPAVLSATPTVVLPLLPVDIRGIEHQPPILHQNTPSLTDSAFVVRISYHDNRPASNLSFRYRKGHDSDYANMIFLADDSITPIAQPQTLHNGDVFFVRCKLKPNPTTGHHEDQLIMDWRTSGTQHTVYHRLDQYVVPIETHSVCEPRTSFTLGSGQVVTENGYYYDTITTNSILNQVDTSIYLCDGIEYQLTDSIMQARDSIVAYILQFFPSPKDTLVAEICDSLRWYGRKYTTTGIYQHITPSDQTCDSLHTLDLNVHYSSNTDLIPRYACDSYVWQGDTITTVGTNRIVESYETEDFCDSTITILIHIKPSYDLTLDTLHKCYRYDWHEHHINAPGSYSLDHMSTSEWGCDSLLHLPLVVHDTNKVTLPIHGCDSIIWNGIKYYINHDTILFGTDRYQCDSITQLHLLVHPSYRTHAARYFCHEGETLTYNDAEYDHTGEYIVSFTTEHGCDSIESLSLQIGVIAQPEIELSPKGASSENLDITLRDTYGEATQRQWRFDDEPYYSDAAIINYTYPYGQDSVVVWLIDNNRYNCPDSVRTIIPFGRGAIWVPNAFTPRQEPNELFRIGTDGLNSAEIDIYTRQGLKVASYDALTGSWDGTYHGQDCPQGAYTYIIKYTTFSQPTNPKYQKGTILLLR